jgi:hypothetical protein
MHGQGLAMGTLLFVLAALGSGIGEHGVHVVHAIIIGLAALGALFVLLFLGNYAMGPLRLVEEERRRPQSDGDATAPEAASVLPSPALGVTFRGQYAGKPFEITSESTTSGTVAPETPGQRGS